MDIAGFTQQRLALFLCNGPSGRPVRKVPVYAEIVLRALGGTPEVHCPALDRLRERGAAVADALQAEIIRTIDLTWFSERCERVVILVVDELQQQHVDLAAPVTDDVRQLIRDAVARAAAQLDAPAPPAPAAFDGRRIPLGMLASDHAGFVSFDLTRIAWADLVPDAQQANCGVEIYAYPMLREVWAYKILDQQRVGPDAIVGKLELPMDAENAIPPYALNLPAMQAPELIDWRLSPGSFAATPESLIGTDGCESLTPANFATSRFTLRQVVRLTDLAAGSLHPHAHVYEFAVSLIPIGHSLGELKYSLPLAPGESVRLAVVDWRRHEDAQRTESQVITEELVHDQTHERLIGETVHAALSEWQHGGSVMGGLAGGAGASGSSGDTSVVGGGMLSIGGGYSTSSGSRDLAAETVQKVTEAIHQASTSTRELHSSVVVQVDQKERENIETRAYSNYNRGHTLTVLYYEVLRHYRVETRFIRRYDAALLPRDDWNLSDEVLLLAKRYALLPALLDPSLAAAFPALERTDRMRKDRLRNPPVAVAPFDEANLVFTSFTMTFAVGGEETSNALSMQVIKKDNSEVPLTYGGNTNLNKDEQFDNENSTFVIASDPVGIRWGDIKNFRFRKDSDAYDDAVRVIRIDIEGSTAAMGTRAVHRHVMGATYYLNDAGEAHFLSVEPPPPPPPTPAVPTFEQSLPLDDYALVERLKDHLNREADYYKRILDLTRNPNAWARRFEVEPWSGTTKAIDAIAPVPLEILGSKVAFRLLAQGIDREPPVIPTVERLISLPTRGVFADAKLGHCNVAEEIDETRFWRWDEHPLPFTASDIAAVQPVQPKPGDTTALTPTTMPAPVVTIQAPTALPAPTAMGDALRLMATPNIFRDMSTSDEVGKLLGKLIDGSVSMADAANQAKQIKSKMDTDLDRQARDQATQQARTNAEVQRAQIEADKVKAQQVTPGEAQHAINLSASEMRKGNKTPEEHQDYSKAVQANVKGATPVKATPRGKPKKIEFHLIGWGGNPIISQWRIDLDQRGTSAGFVIETNTNPNGIVVVGVANEFDDNRYSMSIVGEVLAGFGINAKLNQPNLILEFPKDKYANDYLYVTLKAETDKFHTKASDSTEVTKNFAEHYGLTLEAALKEIITVTGEGGWTWEKGTAKTATHEMEMDVYFYTGGVSVVSYS